MVENVVEKIIVNLQNRNGKLHIWIFHKAFSYDLSIQERVDKFVRLIKFLIISE